MDREKLKLLARNLELLTDLIKAEIYSDVKSYRYEDINPVHLDYDEVFEGDD